MSNTPATTEDDWTPDALKLRISSYIRRIVGFNAGWGIHGRGKRPDGFYGHFFRFDANRMTRMVLAAEHLIRCMIIWLAVRAYRDEAIAPANYRLPKGGPRGTRPPEPPMDPLFKLRALPLHEPRLPPFLISLPEPSNLTRSSLRRHGSGISHPTSDRAGAAALSTTHRESGVSRETGGLTKMNLRATGSSNRKRNDQILDCNLLVDRAHRLSTLLEEIDPRARRLAARWAGYVINSGEEFHEQREGAEPASLRATSSSNQESSPERDPSRERREPRSGRSKQITLNPLKTYWPPPDLLTEAADDEAEDLKELHDVALRATELFHELCG